MTELTKEQLIEEAKLKIAVAKCHPNSGMVQVEGELFKIALTSLEAEPVAWKATFTQINHECNTFTLMNSDKAEIERWVRLHKVGDFRAEITPLYAAPPAMVVPDEMDLLTCHLDGVTETYADGWNACRVAMLQSGNFREIPETSTNSPVTPTLLPGGFTVEDAKELHEDLVRSHISQALSGEKMKKKDRDADLRWIHGVIVQAAWFVKASLEALPEPPQEVNR
ncbi:dTDP-6-deoxy-L-hexose 3-O-methyltransferase [Shigella sonnei]|nr:dTDP-6-deoxy-L-hexose 3-O-methyltransferase [Escherichia coli]EJA5566948.1 dTDP-6-deoxy-L-hexose 3-O-methyltransferase [Escherichia coli]ELD6628323.1 dTDP-6-deoxy-L-hexose 3-O-methyltransferase [Escherichia coli]